MAYAKVSHVRCCLYGQAIIVRTDDYWEGKKTASVITHIQIDANKFFMYAV